MNMKVITHLAEINNTWCQQYPVYDDFFLTSYDVFLYDFSSVKKYTNFAAGFLVQNRHNTYFVR